MPAIVKSVDYGATTLAECVEMAVDRWYQRGRKEGASDAATRMRKRCVERIRHLPADYFGSSAKAYKDRVITALESLTLDGEG